jgi:hypothetical protein
LQLILTITCLSQSRRQNECVALRQYHLRLVSVEVLTLPAKFSQGNFQLRKAPQQDAHSVPSLRLVLLDLISISISEFLNDMATVVVAIAEISHGPILRCTELLY